MSWTNLRCPKGIENSIYNRKIWLSDKTASTPRLVGSSSSLQLLIVSPLLRQFPVITFSKYGACFGTLEYIITSFLPTGYNFIAYLTIHWHRIRNHSSQLISLLGCYLIFSVPRLQWALVRPRQVPTFLTASNRQLSLGARSMDPLVRNVYKWLVKSLNNNRPPRIEIPQEGRAYDSIDRQ